MKTAILAASIVVLLLSSFIVLFLVFYTRRQRDNRREKQLMQTQFEQEILKTQIEIQEQTLKTISEEIHDNVGQVLSLAKLNLNTFPATDDEIIKTKVGDTKQLVSKAINDLRDLSRSLYGDKIADLGLPEAIANELKILQNTGLYQTVFITTGEPFKLESQNEIVIFRIVQEALNNSIKHAKAKLISIEISYTPDIFRLTITDDGNGFDMATLQSGNTGIGLKSMQSRTSLIGGDFLIQSAHDSGTMIQITLNR